MKFKTFISGYNTLEERPNLREALKNAKPQDQWSIVASKMAWNDKHFIQFHRAGKWKPETIRAEAAKRGIVRGLKAYAVSFDESGKGRNIRKSII